MKAKNKWGLIPDPDYREQYNHVGAALLATLAQHFGEAFTPEVKEAWTAT